MTTRNQRRMFAALDQQQAIARMARRRQRRKIAGRILILAGFLIICFEVSWILAVGILAVLIGHHIKEH